MQSGVTPDSFTTAPDIEAAQEELEQQQHKAELDQLRQEEARLIEALPDSDQEQFQTTEGESKDYSDINYSALNQQTDTPDEEVDNIVDTPGEYWDELTRVAVGGGLTRGAESTLTLGEKVVDFFTGEYAREQLDGGYKADFLNPFYNYEHPMARTWWGGILQELVHVGTIYAGLKFAAGKTLAQGTVAKGLSFTQVPATAGWVNKIGAGPAVNAVKGVFYNHKKIPMLTRLSVEAGKRTGGLVQPITQGSLASSIALDTGVVLANSNITEGDTISRKIIDKVPWLSPVLGPMATHEDDSPLAHLFKHVLENAHLVGVLDHLDISKGLGGVNKALARTKNLRDQVVDRAKLQLPETNFRGHKNNDIADVGQGAVSSVGPIRSTIKALDDIDTKAGLDQGSVPGRLTNAQVARMAESSGLEPEMIQKHMEDLISSPQYEAERALWKEQGLTPVQVHANSLRRMQEGAFARDWTEVSTEDFWNDFFSKQAYTGPDTDLHYWTPEHVVTADAINGALLKKIRDHAIATRELIDVTDVLDTDGPIQGIMEKLVVGITNTQRSRYIISNQLSQLKRPTNVDVANVTSAFHQEARETVQMMMDVIGKDPSNDLLEAVVEAFSMSNNIRNFDDLNAYMKSRLRGGDFKGRVNTAEWVKGFQKVMIHSILSGPKTPIRAIMGTSTASFLRPASQALGHAMRLDGDNVRASLAATNAYIEAIPESWKLFKNKLQSYWSGDISTIKTRFSETNKANDQWELLRKWSESAAASDGDKAAFRVANLARNLNDNNFLTYSTKIMAATDDTFRHLMARARAREKAMKLAMNEQKIGNITEITPELLKDAENKFLNRLLDADGNINPKSDLFLESAAKEATLTTELSGFAGGLEDLFSRTPWAKPFFLFARTGINGLALTAKNTPLLNYALQSQRQIFAAKTWTPALKKYGIENMDDLLNAKALAMGRQAIGGSVIFLAGQHFMNGNLTGNGPANRSQRQAWIDSGWVPRSFRVGDTWVSYESMEPFNQVLAAVADIGDNMKLMGPEWAEMNFARAALIVGQGATSKTYMSGLSQLVDLMSGEAHQWQKIIGGMANNTLPLGGLRNEIGKVLNPGMRELSSHLGDTIRNRNLLFEFGPGQDLPKKYDILNGNVINDWWFPHQLWEGIVPISLKPSQGAGRTLLFNSNYDLRMSTYTAPDGTDLSDSPVVRSKFQQALGALNLEAELNKLAKRKDIQNSIAQMEAALKAGNRDLDPMKAFTHNRVIRSLFTRARARAWASLRNDPDVQTLIRKRRDKAAETNRSRRRTSPLSSQYENILQLQPK